MSWPLSCQVGSVLEAGDAVWDSKEFRQKWDAILLRWPDLREGDT